MIRLNAHESENIELFIDIHKDIADETLSRILMYRLRSDVDIIQSALVLSRGVDAPPKEAFQDPRHKSLGWRHYGDGQHNQNIDWNVIRTRHCIPETTIELIQGETYILEAGFERLHGVDFHKGCYVGQEVTARMKHKTTLRKGLVTLAIKGCAPIGTPITSDSGNVGKLYTQSQNLAIAYARYDKLCPDMRAEQAILSPLKS